MTRTDFGISLILISLMALGAIMIEQGNKIERMVNGVNCKFPDLETRLEIK